MAADARPAALALWAPILVICHQRHTLLLPRAVLAHHQDGHDDDYGCDDGKDSGDDVHASNMYLLLAAQQENNDEDSGKCGRNSQHASYLWRMMMGMRGMRFKAYEGPHT